MRVIFRSGMCKQGLRTELHTIRLGCKWTVKGGDCSNGHCVIGGGGVDTKLVSGLCAIPEVDGRKRHDPHPCILVGAATLSLNIVNVFMLIFNQNVHYISGLLYTIMVYTTVFHGFGRYNLIKLISEGLNNNPSGTHIQR